MDYKSPGHFLTPEMKWN